MVEKTNETAALATTQPVTDPADVSEMVAAAVEAAIRKSIGGVGGPVGGAVLNLIIGNAIRPIVDTLSALVAHIGMAVPAALGELVEKLEDKSGWDLNGDGFVGDPEDDK